MKILVTGATGLVGTVLAKKLKERGDEVIALVRKTSSTKELEQAKIKLHYGDITEYNSLLEASKKADAIIHLAAVIHPVNVDESFYYNTNTEGTRNVAKAAVANKVKHVIYSSSVTAYGKIEDESKEITEETECIEQGLYGRTKYKGELVLKEELEGRIPYTIFRIARIMGKGDKSLIIVAKLLKKSLFPVIGSGLTNMMPIHVNDVSDAIILSLNNKVTFNKTYNLAGTEVYTKLRFVNEMADTMGVKRPWLFVPVPIMTFLAICCEFVFKVLNKEPPLSRKRIMFFIHDRKYSTKKIRDDLKYKPKYSMEHIIKETIGWYKENKWI